MGVAQKPPGSVPDTEEVTAQTVVPEELVAMMTNPNLEPQASNANDPHAQEDRSSDVETNETSSAAHDPHAERSHAFRTSGVGLAPLAGSSNLGIAPLGPPPTSRFGASPLGFASPLSAQMPPPEVYSRASRATPLPVPAAPEEATPPTPVSENAANSSAASFPLASTAHVADEPPPDSGWGSERPPLAEGSSEGDDSLTKIIPASRIALESPEAAADSAFVSAASEPDVMQSADVTDNASAQENLGSASDQPDATRLVGDTDRAPFAESINSVAALAVEETHLASVEHASVENEQGWSTSMTPVEHASVENEQGWSTSATPVEHASVENEQGWSTSATPVENASVENASVVSPAEMRVLDDQAARSSESDSVGSAFEEAGTWSQVPLEASQLTPEPSPRGELASTNELTAQDDPAPPASGEVLTGSTSHGAIETASTATSEWRGASATRGATLPGIDLDSASSAESLATPIYVASALSGASASGVTATQAPLKSPESASTEAARETAPEPFARSKIGRTQPPPLPANAVANPADGSELAAFVTDVAAPGPAIPSHVASPAKPALRSEPSSRPPEQIVTPLPRSVPPAMSVAAEVQPLVAGKSRTSKFTLALWALTVVGAFAGGWHWAGTSNQRKLAAASTSLSTQVLAARESGRAEAIAAIPGPPAILDLSVPSGAKSIGEILRMEP
ncbi:MAG: hypothetical protein ACM3ZE_10790, partial [Myxococcales bacterium]